jgi:hypothetical protein
MKNSACMVLAFLTAFVANQQGTAQTITGPTLYRLSSSSGFQQGCFPPCLCPVMIGQPLLGTFLLTPTGFDGLFNTYRVTEVNWLVSTGATNLIVSGSGTYKIGGEFALQQELSLDLQVGPGQVQHFDSGLVAVSSPFPEISVSISLHGEVCFDTVFSVNAAPVPLDQIVSYQLQATSTFQRGCFGLCDCVLGPLEPLLGTFTLVPLEDARDSRAFAMVNVNWVVPEHSESLVVHGRGIYRVSSQSSLEQEMNLMLSIGTEPAAYFDSGLVSGGSNFPSLDIGVSVSGAICFNTWIKLHAVPVATPAAVRPAKARPSTSASSE